MDSAFLFPSIVTLTQTVWMAPMKLTVVSNVNVHMAYHSIMSFTAHEPMVYPRFSLCSSANLLIQSKDDV